MRTLQATLMLALIAAHSDVLAFTVDQNAHNKAIVNIESTRTEDSALPPLSEDHAPQAFSVVAQESSFFQKPSAYAGFIVGLPVINRSNIAFELKKDTPEKVRSFLHLGALDNNFVYMRFGLTPLDRVNGRKTRVSYLTYRRVDERYGPSLGMAFGLTQQVTIEAEYQPEFGVKPKDQVTPTSNRFNTFMRRIDRADTFKIRLNWKFPSSLYNK